jgi:hypothetical protein
MATGEWIVLKGENSHKCSLPDFVENKPYSTMLQKRHAGSVWKCECNLMYEWSGKKWRDVDYAMGR